MSSAAPVISPTQFKNLVKKNNEKKALPPKTEDDSSKEKKTKTKKEPKDKNFVAKFGNDLEEIEYTQNVSIIESTIGTLTNAAIVTCAGLYYLACSMAGTPCAYGGYSIPKEVVGRKRAAGLEIVTDDFLGFFGSETALFAYLTCVMKLPRDNIMVLHSCEYLGITKLNFDTKFTQEKLDQYHQSLIQGRQHKGGSGPLPVANQLAKTKKAHKGFWFYKTDPSFSPMGYRSLDVVQLLSESDRSELGGCKFYGYQDFVEADDLARTKKKENAEKGNYWRKRILEVGEEQTRKEYEEQLALSAEPGSGNQVSGSKRKRTPQVSGANKKKPSQDGIKEVMAAIERKISSRSAENFYTETETSEDEEEDEVLESSH